MIFVQAQLDCPLLQYALFSQPLKVTHYFDSKLELMLGTPIVFSSFPSLSCPSRTVPLSPTGQHLPFVNLGFSPGSLSALGLAFLALFLFARYTTHGKTAPFALVIALEQLSPILMLMSRSV
jgi:hypothetical protein